MDSPISTTLARFKFHTTFDGDSVEHTTHRSDLQSRQRRIVVKTRWTREKELGSGAYGIVWREREEASKELRAVKIIPKHMLNVREIEALAELQDVGISQTHAMWPPTTNRHSARIFSLYSSAGLKIATPFTSRWSTSSTAIWANTSGSTRPRRRRQCKRLGHIS